jgi:hypothetical protein
MGRPEKFTPEEIIKALRKHKGLIYLAAKTLGCSAQTIHNYKDHYPEVKEVIESERGLFVDNAENKLAKAVETGEAWAIALVLKTLGKDRGYVEKIEHGGGLAHTHTASQLPDMSTYTYEQLYQLRHGTPPPEEDAPS